MVAYGHEPAAAQDDVLRRRLSAPRTLHASHHLDVEVASAVRGLAAGRKITDLRGELLTGARKLKDAAGHHAAVIFTR